jgi:ABC-type dipeptide/oligopeptide/nickel transport system ATPase subunit
MSNIDASVAQNAYDVLKQLDKSYDYKYLVTYFKEKKKQVVEEMIERAGVISPEELIKANAICEVYSDLENFDKLIKSDLV